MQCSTNLIILSCHGPGLGCRADNMAHSSNELRGTAGLLQMLPDPGEEIEQQALQPAGGQRRHREAAAAAAAAAATAAAAAAKQQ